MERRGQGEEDGRVSGGNLVKEDLTESQVTAANLTQMFALTSTRLLYRTILHE